MMKVVATAGFLSLVASSTPTGIQGVTCVTVEDETLMHRGHGVPATTAWHLVDRHVPNMLSRGRALTSVELV